MLHKLRATTYIYSDRDLDILQRVHTIRISITSRMCYLGQILPISDQLADSIQKAFCWYVLRGHIFKVTFDTLTLPTTRGGLGLINARHKCRTLLISRINKTVNKQAPSLIKLLMSHWKPSSMMPPIYEPTIPITHRYIRLYYCEFSYIRQANTICPPYTNTKIYNFLTTDGRENRIIRKYPQTKWNIIWRNVHNHILPSRIKSTWYLIVNDKIPTNEKLNNIHLSPTNACAVCGHVDTLLHRFTCGTAEQIVKHMRRRLAIIDRTTPQNIDIIELLRPEKLRYPRRKHNAAIWVLGHTAAYIILNRHATLADYCAYLELEHGKITGQRTYSDMYGNMLKIMVQI